MPLGSCGSNPSSEKTYAHLSFVDTADLADFACPGLDGHRSCFFVAVDSGLLLRRTVYTQMLLGMDPEHIDYEDYRDVGGVLAPFTIKASYIDDNHYGSTRRFAEIRSNVKIDAARFSTPR